MTVAQAHVDIARVAQVLAGAPPAHAWLDDTESARVAALRHPGRRDQYVAGHWLARVLLARTFGGVPAQWPLRERKGLPPEVPGHALHVSISHAGGWIAVAVADVAVGIDIEEHARVLEAAIEPLLREPHEPPGSLDAGTRLRRWVAKEAWIKRGCGSALPARLERVRLAVAEPVRAEVGVWRHEACVLALAIAAGSAVEYPPGLEAVAAFAAWEPL